MNKFREEYCNENGFIYIKPENTSMNDYVEFLENKLDQALTIPVVVESFTAKEVANMLVKDFATIEEAIHYFDNLK